MSAAAPITQEVQRVNVGGKEMPLAQAISGARSCANWFWWIAGLSVVNSLATLLGLEYGMLLGLGITQVADAALVGVLEQVSGPEAVVAKAFHLILVFGAAGFFYLMGVKARAFRLWAFSLGMLVYAADAALFALAEDWVGVGFHVFVLVMLSGGYSLARAVKAARSARPAFGV